MYAMIMAMLSWITGSNIPAEGKAEVVGTFESLEKERDEALAKAAALETRLKNEKPPEAAEAAPSNEAVGAAVLMSFLDNMNKQNQEHNKQVLNELRKSNGNGNGNGNSNKEVEKSDRDDSPRRDRDRDRDSDRDRHQFDPDFMDAVICFKNDPAPIAEVERYYKRLLDDDKKLSKSKAQYDAYSYYRIPALTPIARKAAEKREASTGYMISYEYSPGPRDFTTAAKAGLYKGTEDGVRITVAGGFVLAGWTFVRGLGWVATKAVS